MSRKSRAAEFVQEELPITIKGRHVEVTEAMKSYALEKIAKIEKFNLRVVDVDITMDVQKLDHIIDILLRVDHIVVRSHASSISMYSSIDLAVDKLQTQLRKYHNRIRDHRANKASDIEINVSVLKPNELEVQEVNGDIDEENSRELLDRYSFHDIVKNEKMSLKSLTNDEAIMKMELSGDAFLIFRNEKDRKLKVIYRRNDGNFGVIEPEV
jgi:putative sigma-54 modulation protein